MVTSIYDYDKERAFRPDSMSIEELNKASDDFDTSQKEDDTSFKKQQTAPDIFQTDTLNAHWSGTHAQPNGWGFHPYPYGRLPDQHTPRIQEPAVKATPVETTKQSSSFWSTLRSLWPFGETAKTIEPTSATEQTQQRTTDHRGDEALLDGYKLDRLHPHGAPTLTELPPIQYGWKETDTIATAPSNEPLVAATFNGPSVYFDWLYTYIADLAGDISTGVHSYWQGQSTAAPLENGAQRVMRRPEDEFLSPLSVDDRKELSKLLKTFHGLMSKLREGLSEADIEHLMEVVLQMAREGRNEEFSLQKAAVINKQKALREEQINRLKDVDESIEILKRNKLWNRLQEISVALGYVSIATTTLTAGSGALPFAIVYALLTASKFDLPERFIARVADACINSTFGTTDRAQMERDIYHTTKLLFGLGMIAGTFLIKPQTTSFTVVIQAIVSSIQGSAAGFRGWNEMNYSKKEGEIKHLAFKIEEAQKALGSAMDDFARTHKKKMEDWKSSGKHAVNANEAKISMFR